MKNFKSLIILLSLLAPSFALAWGDLGHEAVAEIAERHLTKKGKELLFRIQGIDPMASAATWPDLVRSDDRYKEFSAYHFIEIPFGSSYEKRKSTEFIAKDGNAIVQQAPGALLSSRSRSEQMILFRYLVHVVGDVHQPLHVGNGLDRGANLCDVKIVYADPGHPQMTNLHSLWDDYMVKQIETLARKNGHKGWFGYKELANIIMTEKESPTVISTEALANQQKQISETPIYDWYKESQALHSVVYPDIKPVKHPGDRTYCKYVKPGQKEYDESKYDKGSIPVIDENLTINGKNYMSTAVETVKTSIWKAGLRLAYLINKQAEKKIAFISIDDKAVLEKVMLTNPKIRKEK